jgi:hypothetical protein
MRRAIARLYDFNHSTIFGELRYAPAVFWANCDSPLLLIYVMWGYDSYQPQNLKYPVFLWFIGNSHVYSIRSI